MIPGGKTATRGGNGGGALPRHQHRHGSPNSAQPLGRVEDDGDSNAEDTDDDNDEGDTADEADEDDDNGNDEDTRSNPDKLQGRDNVTGEEHGEAGEEGEGRAGRATREARQHIGHEEERSPEDVGKDRRIDTQRAGGQPIDYPDADSRIAASNADASRGWRKPVASAPGVAVAVLSRGERGQENGAGYSVGGASERSGDSHSSPCDRQEQVVRKKAVARKRCVSIQKDKITTKKKRQSFVDTNRLLLRTIEKSCPEIMP